MTDKKYAQIAAAAGIVLGLALTVPAFADTGMPPVQGSQMPWMSASQGTRMGGKMGMGNANRGIFGTVTAVNGDTITITRKGFGQNATSTTYTVDATNATVTKSGAASSVSAIAVGDTISVQGTVSGTTVTATTIRDGVMTGMQRAPGVFGTVAAISGNTITVTSKGFGQNATSTTYTVDATNATVTKSGAASSVSAIAVGDTIMVQGTVSGTSVTATKINDGMMMGGGKAPAAPLIAGNGQPIVAGAVTAISGNTITITNKSNVTYTVDATSAQFEKANALGTIASIAVGDNVVVQGTVNGNAITAYSVTDSGPTPSTTGGGTQAPHKGIFSAIGSFFSHLFGF